MFQGFLHQLRYYGEKIVIAILGERLQTPFDQVLLKYWTLKKVMKIQLKIKIITHTFQTQLLFDTLSQQLP